MTAPLLALPSPSSDLPLGRTVPRLWTPPLRELNESTSYGFAVIEFARDVLGEPLDPWQEWIVIHAGELLEDGRPRFRTVLILVARQNGKTHLLKVLALYWLFVEALALIVGMSTNLDYAREAWDKAAQLAEGNSALSQLLDGVRRANGEQCITTVDHCRYKIAASNRRGGRSLSIDRLILDELREHDSWDAWNASVNAMNARPMAQVFAISNQGDDKSVVLDSLRDSALRFIDTGQGDRRLGLFEYSAPDGCEVDDPEAIAQGNPNAGRRLDWDSLLGAATRAKANGGAEEAGHRTEVLCQRVKMLDPAIHPGLWVSCTDPGDLTAVRSRVALCVDVSPTGLHASLAAAGVLPDGRVRVEVVAAWDGPDCTQRLRQELPGWVAKVKPKALGWFPSGPAAALAADLSGKFRRPGWPPAGVRVEGIKDEVTAVCMGFAEQVANRKVAHSNDPLLNAHVAGAEKLKQGDAWRYTRASGNVDALYAAAGAAHLVRTLPDIGKPRFITAGS